MRGVYITRPCFTTTGYFIVHPTEAFTETGIDARDRDAGNRFTRLRYSVRDVLLLSI